MLNKYFQLKLACDHMLCAICLPLSKFHLVEYVLADINKLAHDEELIFYQKCIGGS